MYTSVAPNTLKVHWKLRNRNKKLKDRSQEPGARGPEPGSQYKDGHQIFQCAVQYNTYLLVQGRLASGLVGPCVVIVILRTNCATGACVVVICTSEGHTFWQLPPNGGASEDVFPADGGCTYSV